MIDKYLEDIQEQEQLNEKVMLALFFSSVVLLLVSLGMGGDKKEIKEVAKRIIQKVMPTIEEEEKRNLPKLHMVGSSLFKFLSTRTKELTYLWNNHDPDRRILSLLTDRKQYPDNTKNLIQTEINKIAKTYYRKGSKFSRDVNRGKLKIDILYFSDGKSPFNLDMVKEDFYKALGTEDDPRIFKQVDYVIRSIDYANDHASKIIQVITTKVTKELSRYF